MYIKTLKLILTALSLLFMIVLSVSAEDIIKNESSGVNGDNIP